MKDRRYRGGRSYPIPVWNGIFDHRAKIGSAIWVFLWCLDRVTREEEGVGLVLGGSVVSAGKIANELAFSVKTVREHLQLLDGAYIQLKRTTCGFVITVANSAKFGVWKKATERTVTSTVHERSLLPISEQKLPIRAVTSTVHIREGFDSAVDSAVDIKPAISKSQPNGNSTSEAKAPLPGSEQAEQIWTATLGKLSEKVNRHSFDTWLKPTRGLGVSEGKLFVRIPMAEFSHIGAKFSKELSELLPELSVQFVVPDHAA